MIIICSDCQTPNEIPKTASSEESKSMIARCGACGQMLSLASAAVEKVSTNTQVTVYSIRQASGLVYAAPDLPTLQRWIAEKRISRDDLLATDGQNWQRIGHLPDFLPFFGALPNDSLATMPDTNLLKNESPQPQIPSILQEDVIMPNLRDTNKVDELAAEDLQAPRQPTGRRRTSSRSTLDTILEERPGPSVFATQAVHMTPWRGLRRVLLLLLILVASLAVLRHVQPAWFASMQNMLTQELQTRLGLWNKTQTVPNTKVIAELRRDSVADLNEALVLLTQRLSQNPKDVAAMVGLVDAHLALCESVREQAEVLSKASRGSHKKARLQYMAQIKSLNQEANQHLQDARMLSKNLLLLAPESAATNRIVAQIYQLEGKDTKLMMQYVRRAQALAPQDADVLYVQAGVASSNVEKIAYYEQALTCANNFNRARYKLAQLYEQQKSFVAAKEQLQEILKTAPQHAGAQNLLQQLPATATPGVDAVVVPDPSHSPVANSPSLTHVQIPTAVAQVAGNKSLPQASPRLPVVASRGVVEKLPPLSADASYEEKIARAQLLRSQHQLLDALLLYQLAAAMQSDNAAASMGIGWCQFDLHMDGAIESFNNALRVEPRLAEAHYGLGEAYKASEHLREAIKHYRHYLSIEPNGPMAGLARHALQELVR